MINNNNKTIRSYNAFKNKVDIIFTERLKSHDKQ